MSFARVGHPQHGKGKRAVRLKKAPAPKKEWVSTVNDLSVYKLTNAELSHRHEIHKSRNKAAAQWELKEKALKQHFRHIGSPGPLDQASLSIIREVFSDQLLLKDVLARSDRALGVVKDIFGDAPRMQTGHPSVTMAPKCDWDPVPVHQRLEPPTRLSLMDQQVLNEADMSEDEYSDEDSCPVPACSDYNVIQRTNLQKMKAHSKKTSIQQKEGKPRSGEIDGQDFPATPPTSDRAQNHTALNATVAVQRVRPRQNQSGDDKEDPSDLVSQVLNPRLPLNKSGKIQSRSSKTSREHISQSSDVSGSSVLSGDQSSLRLLQHMLDQVEAELDTLGPDTGAAPWSQRTHAKQGLTGFSVALVSTLGRLVHLLKQKDRAILEETRERKTLEEEVKEQRGLIKVLTSETKSLREDITALQARLQQQTAEVEQKLDAVAMVMGGLGLLEIQDDAHQEPIVQAADFQPAPAADRDLHPLRSCVPPAVLLSPPRQADTWQQLPGLSPVLFRFQFPILLPAQSPSSSSVIQPAPPHQHLSVVASSSSQGVQACISPSSLTSLPLSSLPASFSGAQTSDFSPEAVLAEIAKISRENELIKAQLSQARDLSSAFGGAPDGEQRQQSASSTGRLTPQSVGERSAAMKAAEGQMLLPEESHNLSVSSVEQRLLELNRQSAAARGRLLELIEQQKQNASSVVSPCSSPIPPSAFSPQPAGGGDGPDVSVMLPEREFLSQSSRQQKQSGVPEVSSQSFGGERLGKAQMDRERDGWFALSSHVR